MVNKRFMNKSMASAISGIIFSSPILANTNAMETSKVEGVIKTTCLCFTFNILSACFSAHLIEYILPHLVQNLLLHENPWMYSSSLLHLFLLLLYRSFPQV